MVAITKKMHCFVLLPDIYGSMVGLFVCLFVCLLAWLFVCLFVCLFGLFVCLFGNSMGKDPADDSE